MLKTWTNFDKELMDEFSILFEVAYRDIGIQYAAEEAIFEVLRRHRLDNNNTYTRNFKQNVSDYLNQFQESPVLSSDK